MVLKVLLELDDELVLEVLEVLLVELVLEVLLVELVLDVLLVVGGTHVNGVVVPVDGVGVVSQ